MPLRFSTGAASLIPLAALAARAEGQVDDPGRVRISYEQQSWNETGDAGQSEHYLFAAAILADWTVKSADEKRLVLAARIGEAHLQYEKSRGPLSDSNPGERCSVEVQSGELEAIVTRAGAALKGDLQSLLRSAQVRQGKARISALPASALEPFRAAITSAVFEAFIHLLPPQGAKAETRRFEVRTERGQPAGTFELAFSPPRRWEAGHLSWAGGTARFTPPGGKTVELPDRPARLGWSHQGRRRDEWSAHLEHPGANPLPVSHDTRRRVVVEVRFSARWLAEGAAGADPEPALERVQFAPGQRFLLELSSEEQVQASGSGFTSRAWHEARGLLALAVSDTPLPAGGARFEGLFLAGALREASVANVSDARVLDPASLQVAPSLAGISMTVVASEDGVSLTLDDASWKRTLEGAAKSNAKRAESLRTALSRAVTTCLESALADPARSRPLWSVNLRDPTGKAAGAAALAVDRRSPPESSGYTRRSREVEQKIFRLASTWQGAFAPIPPEKNESGPILSRSIDKLLPMPVEASMYIPLEARPAKAAPTARPSVTVSLRTKLEARQIGGPRYRPAPAAPPPQPAEPAHPPAAAPRTDISPLPPPELAAEAPKPLREKVDAIFASLPPGWDGVEKAIESYVTLEAEAPRSHTAAAVHADIVLRLRGRIDEASLPSLARHLGPAAPFAVRVLAMRLVTHAPLLDDPKRAATLAPLLADPDRHTVIFAGRFLGWIRDPASVEALIGALESLEAKTERGKEEPVADRELRLSLAGDLYRLLGEGASRTASAGFRDLWQRRGKKLPADPFAPGTPTSLAMARAYRTFSDIRAAPIVYLLDASSSMTRPVPASGVPLPPGVGDPARGVLEKLEWARGDLGAILAELEPGSRIQIIAFNKTAKSLHPSLTTLSKESLAGARGFLKGVRSQRGTNIHAALEMAFKLGEVGSICMLTDGRPSAGPGADEIERDVFRWNYLRGVRIVAASFTGDIAHPENLCSRLARRSFGWVRALDTGATAPPPAPAEPPALVDDEED